MGLNISGSLIVGQIEPVQPAQPVARNIKDIIAERLQAQAVEETIHKIEEKDTLPVDENRPIFNSIIDRKENSRYMLDLVKV